MMSLFGSKKGLEFGNILESIITIFVIFIVCLTATFIYFSAKNVMINDVDVIKNNANAVQDMENAGKAYEKLDFFVVGTLIMVMVGIFLTSFFIAADATFFAIVLFLSLLYGFTGYIFSYTSALVILNNIWGDTLLKFPMSILIVTNLHWVAAGQIIVSALALYAKKKIGQFL